HASWLAARADALLLRHHVARVAADPARAPGFERPGGWPGLVYYRLHGSPRTYWSRYDAAFIDAVATSLGSLPPSVDAWCIFDNTASGAAMENAEELRLRACGRGGRPQPASFSRGGRLQAARRGG